MVSNIIKKVKKKVKEGWKKPAIKWSVIGLAVAAGITGLIIGSYHLAYGQTIYPKIKIAGFEVSNLTVEEAEAKLRNSVPNNLGGIEIGFNDQTWEVDLNELNVNYEVETTAKEAYLVGRSERFFKSLKTKWNLWRQGKELALKFNYDEEKLTETVNLIVSQVEEPTIMPELALTQEGQVELIPGKNGRLVERVRLIETFQENLGGLNFNQIEVPTRLVKAQVDGEGLAKAQERAEKIKEKQIVFKYDGWQKRYQKQEILNLISFEADYDEIKIASLAASLGKEINRPAQNASFKFDGQRVVEFKPALEGLKLHEEKARAVILETLRELETDEEITKKTVKLLVERWEAEIKTEEVNDLGIKELLGKGESTFHGSIASREHNVALTANKLNGILLAPGEVFSFNQRLGDVSTATGYQQAYIIKEGRTILGDGGGVCQVSTTFFRAALKAGLPIVERQAHAYRVAYYEQNSPAGIDATVYEPSPDFKFKNDTPAHILIQTAVNTGTNYLKVEIYGTSDGRTATISNPRIWDQSQPPEPLYQDDPTLPAGTVKQVDWAAWGARTAFNWRVVRGNEVLQQRTFYSNFRPWQAVYLRGTGG